MSWVPQRTSIMPADWNPRSDILSITRSQADENDGVFHSVAEQPLGSDNMCAAFWSEDTFYVRSKGSTTPERPGAAGHAWAAWNNALQCLMQCWHSDEPEECALDHLLLSGGPFDGRATQSRGYP